MYNIEVAPIIRLLKIAEYEAEAYEKMANDYYKIWPEKRI